MNSGCSMWLRKKRIWTFKEGLSVFYSLPMRKRGVSPWKFVANFIIELFLFAFFVYFSLFVGLVDKVDIVTASLGVFLGGGSICLHFDIF